MKNPFRVRWETIWKKAETFQKTFGGIPTGTTGGIVVLQRHLEKPNKFRAYMESADAKKDISLDMLTEFYPETEMYLNKKG